MTAYAFNIGPGMEDHDIIYYQEQPENNPAYNNGWTSNVGPGASGSNPGGGLDSEKDYVYFNQSNDLLRATWSKLGKTAPTRYFEDPRTRALDHETFQISPFVGPELEAELVGLCSNVRGVRWHPDFTDLIPADGGKPRGIQRFMAHYGITREQTMAFGDGGNDTDMLAYAGIGVAMGNATAEPKAAADYITDDVDHDGVRNALLHFRVLRD